MLTVVLAVLIVLLVLLAIPIGLDYRLSWPGGNRGEVHLVWLFGLLRVRIPVASEPTAPAKPAHPKRVRKHKTRTKCKTNPLAAWRFKPFRQRILRFIRDLWTAVHKRDVRLQLLIGLSDPADTGQLWALMGPVSAVLTYSRDVEIDIEPDFTESTLEIRSSGYIRVIPLQLLGLSLALLLSPPFWLGLQKMRGAH